MSAEPVDARGSPAQRYALAYEAWNRSNPKLKCLERRFGECDRIQERDSGHIDGPTASAWSRAASLQSLLPARAKRTWIGIADGDREPEFEVRLHLGGSPRPKTACREVPNLRAHYEDFGSNSWALDAAKTAVLLGDDRRKLFAKMAQIVPDWARFPELFLWISDHTTGSKTASGGRLTIPGMASLLVAGPSALAERISDRSIKRRVLLGRNDVLDKIKQTKKTKLEQPRSALDFFRGLHLPKKQPGEIITEGAQIAEALHSFQKQLTV